MTDTRGDVTAVRGPAFDVAALARHLAAHLPGFAPPLRDVSQFGHGQSNPTFLLRDGAGAEFVLRKRPSGEIVSKTAHRIDREFRVMQALGRSQSGVPVPEMLLLCEDAGVIGAAFYIMEFKRGRIFKDTALKDAPRAQRRAIWLALVDVLARLHNVDFRACGLEGFGRDKEYFARQTRSLSRVRQAQRAVDDRVPAIPHFDALVRAINEKQPRDAVSIVHGDFKMDNCIFHPTKPEVIAVIDWELSTIGHYGADLGNSLSPFFITEGDPRGVLLGTPLHPRACRELGLPSKEELMAAYCRRRAPRLDVTRLANEMYFYVGFFCWKNAVIAQGIAARFVTGQASSPHAEAVGRFTPMLGELAALMLGKVGNLSRG